MKRKSVFVTMIVVLSLVFFISCLNDTKKHTVDIIPLPDSIAIDRGEFKLDKKTVVVSTDSSSRKVANYLAKKLKTPTSINLSIVNNSPKDNFIELKLIANSEDKEGYKLRVTSDKVVIIANSNKGLFYGVQSLLQLFPPEVESQKAVTGVQWVAPCVSIIDSPRFKYRGLHLDVCRHFVPVENIKKHLDMMAMFKMNKFHWHLTEDQGWRIEIKAFPELVTKGSKRTQGDGSTYGGYYTQEQVKEIVNYAQDLMIEVIPEIELPGHALGALTAYPEYSCTGGPFKVRNLWGVEADVYCAGKDKTFEFLNKVIDEVAPLFPSKYFHIGGDECPKKRWEKCKLCQRRMQKEGLKTEHDLQSYFVKRVEKMLLKHGKTMIGWDEILEGGLAETAVVMSWRGEKGGIKAAQQGHDVIMTPTGYCYLDYYQGSPKVEPVAIGGYLTLEKVYSYNPTPKKLNADKYHHILGTQGNVWTEYMQTPSKVEYRTYPRIIAIAENGWTYNKNKEYKGFVNRLNENINARLDMHNINYHVPMPEGPCDRIAFVDTVEVAFNTTRPIKMVYTLDRTMPKPNSKEYTKPLIFKKNATLKIASVLPTGRMSLVRTINIIKEKYSPATNVKTKQYGLATKYAKGYFHRVADLKKQGVSFRELPPKEKFDFKKDRFAAIYTGYLNIQNDGVYEFSTELDQLFIDDRLIVNNDGEIKHFSRRDAMIALAKGKHKIKLIYLNNITGGRESWWNFGNMKVRVRQAGQEKFREIQNQEYSH